MAEDSVTIELKPQIEHSTSGVAAQSATVEKPPPPPKRDYASEAHPSVEKGKSQSFALRPEFIPRPEDHSTLRMSCLRPTLIVFNLFIWLLGAVITALGIWTTVDRDFWDIQTNLNMTQFASASYVLIAVGVVIMLIGFVGCYGAAASQLWMLILFAVVVGVVIILEIIVMALVWSKTTSNSQEDVKEIARKAMDQMLEDDNKRYFIDLLQAKLQCCGVDGPENYSSGNSRAIPHSCYDKDTALVYEQGCYDAAIKYLSNKAGVLGGIAVAIFLLQCAAVVLTICLACAIKNSATSGIF